MNNNDYEFRLVNYFLSVFARIAITNKEVFDKFKNVFDELEFRAYENPELLEAK